MWGKDKEAILGGIVVSAHDDVWEETRWGVEYAKSESAVPQAEILSLSDPLIDLDPSIPRLNFLNSVVALNALPFDVNSDPL